MASNSEHGQDPYTTVEPVVMMMMMKMKKLKMKIHLTSVDICYAKLNP
jgi:hypothetical protein